MMRTETEQAPRARPPAETQEGTMIAARGIKAGGIVKLDAAGRATPAERHIRIVGEPHQYPWVIDADTGAWLNAQMVRHFGLPLPLRGEMRRMTDEGEWVTEQVIIVEVDMLWRKRQGLD